MVMVSLLLPIVMEALVWLDQRDQ
jgi:hypothetical protein